MDVTLGGLLFRRAMRPHTVCHSFAFAVPKLDASTALRLCRSIWRGYVLCHRRQSDLTTTAANRYKDVCTGTTALQLVLAWTWLFDTARARVLHVHHMRVSGPHTQQDHAPSGSTNSERLCRVRSFHKSTVTQVWHEHRLLQPQVALAHLQAGEGGCGW